MLHDPSIRNDVSGSNKNRRKRDRSTLEGEVVLRWSHDYDTPIRYTIIDRSEGGMRIMSQFPLTEGMTGVITRYLPEGVHVHLPMMVVWSNSTSDEDGYYCGIWFMGTE